MIKLPFLFSLLLSWGTTTYAATCCGGSVAAPALITGDDRAQVSLSIGQTQVSDDVFADGTWNSRTSRETTQTWTVEAAHIFKDRWQAGVAVPVLRRERLGTSATGLGDVTGNVGYEYLPDWDYNPWRPRGLGFIQVSVPAGRSIFESQQTYQLDTRGRGFWSLGAGTIMNKVWGRWDALAVVSVRRSFARGAITPGWGGSAGGGGGYSFTRWRLGLNLTWSYEDPIHRSGNLAGTGSVQRFATAAASMSVTLDEDWSASLSYQDQTLFGAPVNTNLSRGFQLQAQRHWSR